ncbi:MAG: hypothetical protein C0501_09935 [Isosphaera sp.]|nr:hypothetical protein [Isosphaera sp.]
MLAALSLFAAAAADTPGGWPDLFPELGNFSRAVSPPVVAKGEKPAAWSQSAKYEWLGGRFEVLTVTVARDPAFRERYAAEAVKKGKPAPEAVEVNKKRAYLWDKLAGGDDLEKVSRRLVVVLADDTVLTVEQRGFGLELPEVAKKLDLDKVTKALASPPPAAAKKE